MKYEFVGSDYEWFYLDEICKFCFSKLFVVVIKKKKTTYLKIFIVLSASVLFTVCFRCSTNIWK